MKVRELVVKLLDMDPEAEVLVRDICVPWGPKESEVVRAEARRGVPCGQGAWGTYETGEAPVPEAMPCVLLMAAVDP